MPSAGSEISTPTTTSSAFSSLASTTRTLMSRPVAIRRFSRKPDSHSVTATVARTTTIPWPIVASDTLCLPSGTEIESR